MFSACFSSPQAAVEHLGEGASIINIGSAVTSLTPPGSSIYTGTKGAVDAIYRGSVPRTWAAEDPRQFDQSGIVQTEGTHTAGFVGSDFENGIVQQTPLGRAGQPQDIASVAVFLASDDSGWVSGETLIAGGGLR